MIERRLNLEVATKPWRFLPAGKNTEVSFSAMLHIMEVCCVPTAISGGVDT